MREHEAARERGVQAKRKEKRMRCSEIIACLEQLSPPSFAEEWDNVGLLVGRKEKEVSTVFIALDATEENIHAAIRAEADLLITHHPMIFHSIKKVTDEDYTGRRIVKLLRYDISYYAMHTNFDVMGMADAAADDLKLNKREVLLVTFEDDLSKEGIGRIGFLDHPVSLKEMGEIVKEAFHLPDVRIYGDLSKTVRKVAICPGSGGSVIPAARKGQADVLITGDLDYHESIDAVEEGLCLMDAGHYGIEKLFISYMNDFLKRELPDLQVKTAPLKEPFTTV